MTIELVEPSPGTVHSPLPRAEHLTATPSLAGPTATSPLPLPTRHWGAAQALLALDEARLSLPLHLPDATVISALTTVVLRSGGAAVKVYPPGTDPAHLDLLAAALGGTSTAHLPDGRPVVTSHGIVTVTPWLPAAPAVTWEETGALLRRFHTEHATADVPVWTPSRGCPPRSRASRSTWPRCCSRHVTRCSSPWARSAPSSASAPSTATSHRPT